MDAVADGADRYGVRVVEEAAHAPGSSWRGRSSKDGRRNEARCDASAVRHMRDEQVELVIDGLVDAVDPSNQAARG
jgi:hypothetical protein